MLLNQEGLLHKSPEFCHAIKFVIKLQISTLLQQLAESGEESIVLTANVLEGTADRLGSHRGAGFLEGHEQLGNQFLAYCAETRRLSVDDDGDHLPPRSSCSDNNLLSPTLTTSVSPYSRSDSVRARFERESSTSDSVFSPDRRKSSASSKSLDEDVAMLTSQEYSDTPRSLSDSSATWPDSSGNSLDTSERPVSVNRYTGITRSPTNRSAPESFDKPSSKHTSKSPLSESVEHIKQITLSSPSEFQYKKYQHSAGGFPGGSGSGTFDPQRLPPMFESSPPQKLPPEFVVPNISGDESVNLAAGNMTFTYGIKSEPVATSHYGGAGTASKSGSVDLTTTGVSNICVDDDLVDRNNPVVCQTVIGSTNSNSSLIGVANAAAGGHVPHIGSKASLSGGEISPLSSSGSESVFSQYPVYKVPFTTYGDRSGIGVGGTMMKISTSEDGGGSSVGMAVSYSRQGYDAEEMEAKYKSHFLPPEVVASLGLGQGQAIQGQAIQGQAIPGHGLVGQSEPYSSLTEGREYQSEMGEIYRLPKKMESKLYHQRHGGGSRKQPKSSIERRGSDSVTMQSFESNTTLSTFVQMKEKEGVGGTVTDSSGRTSSSTSLSVQDVVAATGQSDISKSFEDAVKIQQSIYQATSLGLLSPLQRQFLQPGRPYPQRERSQSLSEFQTMASHELATHNPGRARFPSSSFADNLDTPLIIDDDSKLDLDTREGLDLSNKRRKMSVDDVYSTGAEEQMDGAGLMSSSASANQVAAGEESEYDRLVQGQFQGGATGTSRSGAAAGGGTGGAVDESAGGNTKKYGKGNFIKVATGYQCRICCRVIRHMNNTTAHMRIHANVKPYKCQVCNQQFKYEVDRRYHFSKNHVDLFSKMYFPEEKKSG